MISPWQRRYFRLYRKRRRHRPPGKYSSFRIDGAIRHGWVILVFDSETRSRGNYKVYFN